MSDTPNSAEFPRKAGRREWIGLAVIALPCLLYSMDLTVLNLAVPAITADLEPERHTAPLDRRHLRLHDRRRADHHGHARRPHRPPQAADDRRLRLRARLDPRGVLDQRGNADRRAGSARPFGGDACAVDAVADLQHVPRPEGADLRHRRLDFQLLGRRRDRPADRRRAADLVLVGLGVPDRRAGDAAAACRRRRSCCRNSATRMPGGSTLSAPRCRWSPCLPSSTASSMRRPMRWTARPSARSSSAWPLATLFVWRQRRLAEPLIDLKLFSSLTVLGVARHQCARLLRRLRHLPADGAVSAACARTVAAGGRPLERAVVDRLHRRFAACAETARQLSGRPTSWPAAMRSPRSASC